MWLSLICANVKSASPPAAPSAPNTRAVGMPLFIAHTTPAPAHAMHLRKPRRSMPSLLASFSIRSDISTPAAKGKGPLFHNDGTRHVWVHLAEIGVFAGPAAVAAPSVVASARACVPATGIANNAGASDKT